MTKSLLVFLALTLGIAGKDPVDPVNKDRSGIALKGYDAVAYFDSGKPVKGDAQFEHSWMDARWRFASKANRDKFAADPARYAPQFGGYCSWAVSQGYTAPIDPEAWKIVGGKLYLNYDKGVQSKWEKDLPKLIGDAERNWPRLHR